MDYNYQNYGGNTQIVAPQSVDGTIKVTWTENRVKNYNKREATVEVTVPFGTDLSNTINYLRRQIKDVLDESIKEVPDDVPQNTAKSNNGGYKGGGNKSSNTTYNGPTVEQVRMMTPDQLLGLEVPKQFFGNRNPMGYNQYGCTLMACSKKELAFLSGMTKYQGHPVVEAAKILASMGYGLQPTR